MEKSIISDLQIAQLRSKISGEVLTDRLSLIAYSTDASVYSEEPAAVVISAHVDDIHAIVEFAGLNKIPLIPRAGGTSLAGQVVGSGVVVDVSKNLTQILELNTDEKWVRVQPGVILDELNRYLKPHGLFFGPETSTANRCTLGGMVGNNACGLHAVVYGTTRDHLMEVKGFLSDGSLVHFKPLTSEELTQKLDGQGLENQIYRYIFNILSDKSNQEKIRENFPHPGLVRRNHGYALDVLLDSEPFAGNGKPFNLSKLIAGSEGTLLFITELKLNLVSLPPANKALVCVHFETLDEALRANIIALKHPVTAVELMDDIILEASKGNIEQQRNRFFVERSPKALLMIELVDANNNILAHNVDQLIHDIINAGLGYAYPVLRGSEINQAWELRKAGLGLMTNIPGDVQSVTVIEDTAVYPGQLPEYIAEFTKIMDQYGERCVYHAHAGTGEIHLRPRLNLKKPEDIVKFEKLAWEIAALVKKYKGSLSGEHGDGRLRGQFIPFMLGNEVYGWLKELKQVFDPDCIFNPGKIIDTPKLIENLRYKAHPEKEPATIFDFTNKLGIIRAAESCNGSGDCRKWQTAGGTMCPSYMATRDERNSTRARANTLRYFLTRNDQINPFEQKEIYDVLDLCLSCKACKSECPSSVDVAKMKAEFLQHYYDKHGIPFRVKAIAGLSALNRIGSAFPKLTNWLLQNKQTSLILKKILKFAPQRQLPLLSSSTLRKQISGKSIVNQSYKNGKVFLFVDEFTNYNDSHVGIKAIRLLNRLGYEVQIASHSDSGRALISKGLLRRARKLAIDNVYLFSSIISDDCPLIGLEPSAILAFRDEYPDLVGNKLKAKAQSLARNVFLFDEFIDGEIKKGKISAESFTSETKLVKVHGHCQQKAVASVLPTLNILSLPKNYKVSEIKSGCCGMAGSFGYEKEHYELSMKVGELVLFPEVRSSDNDTIIVAAGTSCRHQIYDGTQRKALHPAEVLFDALI